MKRITITVVISEEPNDTVGYSVVDSHGRTLVNNDLQSIADASLDIGATIFENAEEI